MDMFSVLADQNRRSIIELLVQKGQLSASDIYGQFKVSGSAISQHLKVLKEAEVVVVERKAQQRIYQLNPKKLDDLEGWVTNLKIRWNARLDRLEQVLAAQKRNYE